MGYAGGTSHNPTYRAMGDHAETLQLSYDPKRISYTKLLDLFWSFHNPVHEPYSRQYMSIILCSSEDQYNTATSELERRRHHGTPLQTEIVARGPFYSAEDYHQKWTLQHQDSVMAELNGLYPNFATLVDSPTAARLNAVLAGYLDRARLEQEISLYGLSKSACDQLLKKTR